MKVCELQHVLDLAPAAFLGKILLFASNSVLDKSTLNPYSSPSPSPHKLQTHTQHSQPLILDGRASELNWIGLPGCGVPQTIGREKNKTYLFVIKKAIMSFEVLNNQVEKLKPHMVRWKGLALLAGECLLFMALIFFHLKVFPQCHLYVWYFVHSWKQKWKLSRPLQTRAKNYVAPH